MFSTLSKTEISTYTFNLDQSEILLFGKELRVITSSLTLYHIMTTSDALGKKAFENVGKEENAGNQHFFLFPQCFLSYERQLKYFE